MGETESHKSLIGCILGHNFRVTKKIGAGSFGEIYSGVDERNQAKVAIKIESSHVKPPQLELEYQLYTCFDHSPGFPEVYWYGTEKSRNILVFELLGPSLEDLFISCHHKMSLKTVLMLVDQMLCQMEYFHSKGFIHRDVKSDNFLVGCGTTSNQVYIIDYGLSRRYIDPISQSHIPFSETRSLVGTARYASVRALKGCEQSRRDDLESLGYVWLYLLRGSLPWQGIPAKTNKQKYERICRVKSNTPFEILCDGFPTEFVTYFKAVQSLEFNEAPKYSEYRSIFRDLFCRLGYTYDYKYDWSAKGTPNESLRPWISKPPKTQPESPANSQRKDEQLPSIHSNSKPIQLAPNGKSTEKPDKITYSTPLFTRVLGAKGAARNNMKEPIPKTSFPSPRGNAVIRNRNNVVTKHPKVLIPRWQEPSNPFR